MMNNGLSVERARLYGMPHINAYYPNSKTTKGKLDYEAVCAVCGKPASNAHHAVPLGFGGGNAWKTTNHGSNRLRTALIAVCGMGNTSGCHGMFHSGDASIRWEWDDPSFERMWEEGKLLFDGKPMKPHSQQLYNYGCYRITTPKGEVVYRG